MTDEFLFRSILFSSAPRLALEDGHPDLDEPKVIVEPNFGQLNQRLKHYTELSDSTIAIVACLAMVEVCINVFLRKSYRENFSLTEGRSRLATITSGKST